MSIPAQLIVILFTSVPVLTACDAVVNYFAFHPDSVNVLPPEQLPDGVGEFTVTTDDHVDLQGLFLPRAGAGKVLIYFQGNAGNIYHRIPDLVRLRESGVSVVGAGYRGYGNSEGVPDEAGLYRDGDAIYRYVVEELGYRQSNIIVLGRSIGTTVALHIAQHHEIGGLILVTPLTSGKAHAQASGLGVFASIAEKSFDNLSRIRQVTAPLLVIHGTDDRVIPFSMGKEIYDSATTSKRFVKIEGAGHNDLQDSYGHYYWPPVIDFINTLDKSRSR
jgi:uncharacterized protein